MRAFVAVELSSELRDAVAAIASAWQSRLTSARWVRPENLHLTLRFLGDAPPDALGNLAEALRDVARNASPFTLALRSVGCFPSPKRARVLWVGVTPVPEELVRLHEAVESAVRECGFAAERRRFAPHLTIARLRRADGAVGDVIASLDGVDFGATRVAELVLFESRLSPKGAIYRALERFPLGGPVEKELV